MKKVIVHNSSGGAIKVGTTVVKKGADAEVDAEALAAMSEKDAGPAANANAAALNKPAGRSAAETKANGKLADQVKALKKELVDLTATHEKAIADLKEAHAAEMKALTESLTKPKG